ncbi:MAG: methyltransferase domain-containing protein [Firmicutes bacterium]|nr:methyltransferase domain-containing protein [Bacillota bacterium]
MSNLHNAFPKDFIDNNLMGPNVIKLAEEVARQLSLTPGMKVLDLGCGKALSSIYLAKEFGATVFATDLWIPATENFERIKEMGVENLVYPIHAEAHALPYADGFFDAIVCFDAYHYFGTDERYLNDCLVKLLKKGGQIGMAIPGFSRELSSEELHGYGKYCESSACGEYGTEGGADALLGFHTKNWWQAFWSRINAVKDVRTWELTCNRAAWEDWVNCLSPIGQDDKAFFENVNEIVTVGLIAKRS